MVFPNPTEAPFIPLPQRQPLLLRQAVEWRSPRNRENTLMLDDVS